MRLGHDHRRRRLVRTAAAERDGGYILVMFAMLLIPILLLVGFSVDVGYWYNRASDIQKAADAAALAGVPWLPDEAKAREVALETAKKNGFDDADPDIEVLAAKSTKAPNRLQVTIRDRRVGSFIYQAVGGSDLDMSRDSFAEYVTPVPMGSPRNFFGLGTLLLSNPVAGFSPEYLFQSVNPYCTDKVNGDRHQSSHFGGTCTGTANAEYRATGYELYIEAPVGRTSPIDVLLYDARYNATQNYAGCTIVYTSNWTGPATQNTNLTITGPALYQTRANNTTSTWSATQTLAPGDSLTRNRRLLRYRPGDCQEAGYRPVDEKRQSGSDSYTFSLFGADSTPLDDTDNPLLCEQTFDENSPFDPLVYLGSNRWNSLCTISPSAPSGKYILRVRNSGTQSTPRNDGSNQWGLVAKYQTSNPGLCDGRNDPAPGQPTSVPRCPRVYGKDAISVRAATTASIASFFLAEIGPMHAGKKLRLELFDPGEGGSQLEIMRPTMTNSWEPVAVSWTSVGASPSSGSGTSIDVTGSRFNGRLLEITVDLTGYNPPVDNNWWQIRYTFNDPDTPNVTDRTTWSARILGDPVHLIEE